MIFGYKRYIADGDGFYVLCREISRNKIPVRDMQEIKGRLHLKLSAEYCGKFEKLCKKCGYTFEVQEKRGLFTFAKSILGRPGLISGFIVSLGALIYLSDIALRFEVLSDDPDIRKKVIQSLEAQGVTTGTYIPDIDYVEVERAVRKSIDEISWVGISRRGNGLVIDVVDNIEGEKMFKNRMPSNLIATENGVIEKLDILDGQVRIGVGSGVVKGDVIVSGEVITTKSQWIDGKEVTETKTSYTRSIGGVYGTFERKVVFEQPFEDRKEYYTGDKDKISYLNLFSAEIPLFADIQKGYYRSETEYSSVPEIFGVQFPVGITTVELEEYDFHTETLTEEQAKESVADQAYRYEVNFLKDYEINDRKSEVTITETGVTQTVTYTLYGEMSGESEFFIPKS